MSSDVDDPIKQLIQEKIKAAEGGQIDAANSLIKEFCASVGEGINDRGDFKRTLQGEIVNIHPEVAKYFWRCFRRYLEDDIPINQALNIKSPRGRPTLPGKASRDIEIATKIAKMMIYERTSLYDASLELSDQYHLHESRIRDAYTENISEALAALVEENIYITK